MAYSQEELNSIVQGLIIDNDTNQITPAKVRAVFEAVISSLSVTDATYVSATPPLYLDAFTNVFSIIKADATTNGYLSKEDWVIFNSATGATTPDATNTIKGKLKLTGDLAGTADLPTVPALTTKADLVDGIVPSYQLPAYVDEVYDGYLLSNVFYSDASHTIVIPAALGKIYVDITSGQKNRQYRYSGSTYIQITNGLIASTDDVSEGSTNKYSTLSTVMAYVLTGVSFVTGTPITAADTILTAFGKIQKQINDVLTSKQDALISGTNIKTINSLSIVGSGNLNTPDMDTTTAQTVSGIKTFLNGIFGLRNVANTFTSFFTNTNTASRTYTLQNSNGTLMFCDASNSNLAGTGSVVQMLSSTGVPSRGGKIVTLFAFVQATSVTVINASLTSVLSGSILGNLTLLSSSDTTNPMLVVGKSFSGKAVGIFSIVSLGTFQIIIKIGTITILDTSAISFLNTLTSQSFEINYDFTVLTQGSTGTIIANLKIFINDETIKVVVGSPVTIDTTSNQNLDIQCAYGATNAGNTVTFKTIKGINDAN